MKFCNNQKFIYFYRDNSEPSWGGPERPEPNLYNLAIINIAKAIDMADQNSLEQQLLSVAISSIQAMPVDIPEEYPDTITLCYFAYVEPEILCKSVKFHIENSDCSFEDIESDVELNRTLEFIYEKFITSDYFSQAVYQIIAEQRPKS